MTNKKAISILAIAVEMAKGRCFVTDEAISDAYAMAISALQAQDDSNESSSTHKALDTISRQKEIFDLCSECQCRRIPCANYPCGEVKTLLRQLPSAQPKIEERKEESAQNVPKEDLISRKAAIDAECEVCQIAPKKESGHNCTYYVHGCKEIECLRALPSAQPEIVRCGQCKYAEVADAQDNQDGYTCQFHRWSIWFSGSYCSWGERRTDEGD